MAITLRALDKCSFWKSGSLLPNHLPYPTALNKNKEGNKVRRLRTQLYPTSYLKTQSEILSEMQLVAGVGGTFFKLFKDRRPGGMNKRERRVRPVEPRGGRTGTRTSGRVTTRRPRSQGAGETRKVRGRAAGSEDTKESAAFCWLPPEWEGWDWGLFRRLHRVSEGTWLRAAGPQPRPAAPAGEKAGSPQSRDPRQRRQHCAPLTNPGSPSGELRARAATGGARGQLSPPPAQGGRGRVGPAERSEPPTQIWADA